MNVSNKFIIGVGENDNPLPSNSSKKDISNPITFVTEKIASLIFWVKNHQDKELYSNMKAAIEGDRYFESLKISKTGPEDKQLKPAKTAFLETAWHLQVASKPITAEDVITKMDVNQARVLTDLMPWPFQDNSQTCYVNIQRGYPNPEKQNEYTLPENEAKNYLEIFRENHKKMQEAFINFRHEVVSHQKSISRAWKGASNDPALLEAREKLMNQFKSLLNNNVELPPSLKKTY